MSITVAGCFCLPHPLRSFRFIFFFCCCCIKRIFKFIFPFVSKSIECNERRATENMKNQKLFHRLCFSFTQYFNWFHPLLFLCFNLTFRAQFSQHFSNVLSFFKLLLPSKVCFSNFTAVRSCPDFRFPNECVRKLHRFDGPTDVSYHCIIHSIRFGEIYRAAR